MTRFCQLIDLILVAINVLRLKLIHPSFSGGLSLPTGQILRRKSLAQAINAYVFISPLRRKEEPAEIAADDNNCIPHVVACVTQLHVM